MSVAQHTSSFFLFKTSQIVVMIVMPNVCPMALINFPSFPNFKMACFSPIDSTLVFKLGTKMHFIAPRQKPRLVMQNYLMFEQSTEICKTCATRNSCQSHVHIVLLTWEMGGFKKRVICLELFNTPVSKYQEIKADILNKGLQWATKQHNLLCCSNTVGGHCISYQTRWKKNFGQ